MAKWAPVQLNTPAGNVPAGNLAMELFSPWTPGAREGGGIYTWLSFPAAVSALLKKLPDHPDQALFVLAVSAASYQELAQQCAALSAVFPLKQLSTWQKQADRLVTLEADKRDLVATVPSNSSAVLQAVATVQERLKKQLSQQAKASAAGLSGADPLSGLNALESAKAAFDAGVDAALPPLTGGTGWRFYASEDIAAELIKGHPDERQTLTVMIAWFGAPAVLSYLVDMMPEVLP